jgi:hypothetical protein
MKRSLIILTAAILLAGVPGRASALITVAPVTKDTQAAAGLVYTLTAVRESGFVWVHLDVPRKDRLATLSDVNLEFKDEKGNETLLAPLATTDEKGVTRTHFRLRPEQAERCNIILVTEKSTPPAPAYAVNYSIRLKEYITDGKK